MVLEKLFEVQSGLPETHVLDMFDMFSALWVDERLVADTFAFLPKERWLVVLVRPEMQHCVHWKCRECQDCSTHFGGGTSSFATRPEHCVSWCFFWKFGRRKNRFWDFAVATVALAMVHTRYPLVLEDAGMIEPHVEPTQEVHESSPPGQLESFADSIFKFFNATWHSRDLFLFSDGFAALSIDTINPISDIMFCNVLHQSGDKQLTIYIYVQRCLSCPFWC